MTAKRYISLVTPNTSEDQFGYGDSPPVMSDYQRISVPLFTIFAEKDEYADRPVEEIKKVFDAQQKSSNYSSFIIQDSLHSLKKKEAIVVAEIIAWIRKIA
jgi:esterase/lipase